MSWFPSLRELLQGIVCHVTLIDGSLGGEGEERRRAEEGKRERKEEERGEEERRIYMIITQLAFPPSLLIPLIFSLSHPSLPLIPPSLTPPPQSLTLNILIFSMSIGSEKVVA